MPHFDVGIPEARARASAVLRAPKDAGKRAYRTLGARFRLRVRPDVPFVAAVRTVPCACDMRDVGACRACRAHGPVSFLGLEVGQ